MTTASTPNEFESLHEIIQKAHQVLPKEKWDSLVGGAETETTLKRNRLAIDSIAFKPRVLRNVSKVDLSVEHFGRKLRLPVFFAPAGPLNLFSSGGGVPVVSAAQAFEVGHMLSSGCTPLETRRGRSLGATNGAAIRQRRRWIRA